MSDESQTDPPEPGPKFFISASSPQGETSMTLIMRSGFPLGENPLVLSHHCRGLMYSRAKGITLDAADIRPSSF